MIFIALGKWMIIPTKEMRPKMEQFTKAAGELENQGIKIHPYWTLRRYDMIATMEAPTEKDAMKALLTWAPAVDLETLTTVPRGEAVQRARSISIH